MKKTIRDILHSVTAKECSYSKEQRMGNDKDDVRIICTAPNGGTTPDGKPIKRNSNCPYANTSWVEAMRYCKGYK